MYIILRNKYKFIVSKKEEDNKWIYLTGKCFELLGNRQTTICLENTFKNKKRMLN